MLDSLARMGYVKPIEAACGDACDKCSMSGSCGAGLGGRVWVLTEKSRGVDRSVGGER